MSYELVIELARETAFLALIVAGPMLLAALAVGLVVSMIQAVTQIQEQTLSFVPKLFAIGAVFLLVLPWIIHQLVRFTGELLRGIPTLAA